MRSSILSVSLLTLAGCIAAGVILAIVDPDATVGSDFFAAVAQVIPVLLLAIVIEEAFLHSRRVEYMRGAQNRLLELSRSVSAAAQRDEQRRAQLREERDMIAQKVADLRQQTTLPEEELREWEAHFDELDRGLKDDTSVQELREVLTAAEAFAEEVGEAPAASASEAKRVVVSTLLLGICGEVAALLALLGVSTLPLTPLALGSVAGLFLILGTDFLARFRELPEMPTWQAPEVPTASA